MLHTTWEDISVDGSNNGSPPRPIQSRACSTETVLPFGASCRLRYAARHAGRLMKVPSHATRSGLNWFPGSWAPNGPVPHSRTSLQCCSVTSHVIALKLNWFHRGWVVSTVV